MDYEKLFPGRFLKSAELDRDVTLTLAGLKQEEIDGKVKAIVRFEETKKEWVLNRTNAEHLKLMFGRETDAWMGKRVTLTRAKIDAFGEATTAIRVRGSPDITKAAEATVQRGRKTIRVSVVPTGTGKGGKATAAPAPYPAPEEPSELERLCIAIRELGAVVGLPEQKVEQRLASITTVAEARAALAKLKALQ